MQALVCPSYYLYMFILHILPLINTDPTVARIQPYTKSQLTHPNTILTYFNTHPQQFNSSTNFGFSRFFQRHRDLQREVSCLSFPLGPLTWKHHPWDHRDHWGHRDHQVRCHPGHPEGPANPWGKGNLQLDLVAILPFDFWRFNPCNSGWVGFWMVMFFFEKKNMSQVEKKHQWMGSGHKSFWVI